MATVEYQQLYSDAIQTPLLLSNTKKMQKRRTFFPQLALFTPQSPSSLLADTLWILAGFSHSLIATCMDVNRRRQEISFVIEGSARSLDFSTLNPDNIVEFMDTPESKEALQGQLDVINAKLAILTNITDSIPEPLSNPSNATYILSVVLFLAFLYRFIVQHSNWRYHESIMNTLFIFMSGVYILSFGDPHTSIIMMFSWAMVLLSTVSVAVHKLLRQNAWVPEEELGEEAMVWRVDEKKGGALQI